MNVINNKRVLVTGATGLIGSHLIETLLAENAEVIALGRSKEKLENIFEKNLKNEKLLCIEGNISEKLSVELGQIDLIFHAASPIAGDEIKKNPVDVIEANLSGVINCLEYLKKQKEALGIDGKLIVFSSATVYGNDTEKDKRVTEEDTQIADALDTLNAPYSESKRMCEVIAKAYYKQYNVKSVIVRIGWVYGYTKAKPNTAFYEFVNKALKGEDIVFNNSGFARRDNIYVQDVVNGLLCVSEKGIPGESYNISSNGEKGNFAAIDEMAEEIVASILKLNNIDIRIVKKLERTNRSAGIVIDNNKLKALGWKIQTSLSDGIYQTVKDYGLKDE